MKRPADTPRKQDPRWTIRGPSGAGSPPTGNGDLCPAGWLLPIDALDLVSTGQRCATSTVDRAQPGCALRWKSTRRAFAIAGAADDRSDTPDGKDATARCWIGAIERVGGRNIEPVDLARWRESAQARRGSGDPSSYRAIANEQLAGSGCAVAQRLPLPPRMLHAVRALTVRPRRGGRYRRLDQRGSTIVTGRLSAVAAQLRDAAFGSTGVTPYLRLIEPEPCA